MSPWQPDFILYESCKQVSLELDGNLDPKRGRFETIASLPEMLVGVGDLPVFSELLGDPRCVRVHAVNPLFFTAVAIFSIHIVHGILHSWIEVVL